MTTNTWTRPAPVWQKIGNTGLPTQNWWIQFDHAGNMYVAANNGPAGGVSKSTNKGYTWTVINTGFTCHLHRGMGLAPDGTLFVGNDYCNEFNQGLNHFYWLDNVSGNGTHWTTVTTPSSNSGGQINGSVIANDGVTIVSATYGGIWLSTNNARSWFLAPGQPTGVAEGIDTYKQPDGTLYAGFANGGVFYSHDNGYHWTKLGYPPGNVTNGDVWAMTTAPAGAYAGYLMVFAGNPALPTKPEPVRGAMARKPPPMAHGTLAETTSTRGSMLKTSRILRSIWPRPGSSRSTTAIRELPSFIPTTA